MSSRNRRRRSRNRADCVKREKLSLLSYSCFGGAALMINTSRGRLMYPNVSCLSCVCRHRDGASIVCVYKCMSRLFKLTSVAISVNVLRPQKITQRNATQRKAKQSKAKQSKAKQSKAEQSRATHVKVQQRGIKKKYIQVGSR